MLRYVTKGFTLGHILTRQSLRTLLGLPGLIIDLTVALFYLPFGGHYLNFTPISYADDTSVTLFRGIFGWIGEVLGFVIGPIIGVPLSIAIYAVDTVLWLYRRIQEGLFDAVINFANWFGEHFDELGVLRHPDNYFEWMLNLGAVIIGAPVTIVPFLFLKLIELIIPPLDGFLAAPVTAVIGRIIGGSFAALLCIPAPAFFIIDRIGLGYDIFRDKFQSFIAFLYAKSGESPSNFSGVFDSDDLHSNEFHDKYRYMRDHSWTDILFGVNPPPAPVAPQPAPAPVAPQPAPAPVAPQPAPAPGAPQPAPAPGAPQPAPALGAPQPAPALGALQPAPAPGAPQPAPVPGALQPAPARPACPVNDPLTKKPLGDNAVEVFVDRHGHSFNDDRKTGRLGIFGWISREHCCPIQREELVKSGQLGQLDRLEEQDLKPNVSLNEMMTINSDSHLEDPITYESLGSNGVNVVVDCHGHSFNDDRGTNEHGIFYHVREHHTCPISTEPLAEDDLKPNSAFNALKNVLRPGG